MIFDKLRFDEHYVNGESKELEVFGFFWNKENNIIVRRIDTAIFIGNIRKRSKLYLSKENLYLERIKGLTKFSNHNLFKTTDLDKLVSESEYDPFSLWFLRDFFDRFIYNSLIYKGKKMDADTKWLYRKFFYEFLKLFTNIEELADKFIEDLEKNKNDHTFIRWYREHQIALLLFSYIKRDKERKDRLKNVEVINIDGKGSIFQDKNNKKIKWIYALDVYFLSDFESKNSLLQ